jgi:hypothetical protein
MTELVCEKNLNESIEQVIIMANKIKARSCIKGHNLQYRTLGDITRITNSAWLALYEHLHDNGIEPESLFPELEEDET